MNSTSYTLEPALQAVLLAVYEMGAADVSAQSDNLALRLGMSPGEVARALRELDAARLLCSARCRLTMSGLVLAARLARGRIGAHSRAA